MAKKSVRSKGYRKSVAKKPYLSKKEIIALCAIVVAVILGIVLFNVFYDDGSLKVVDGVVQTQGANSLVVNAGTAKAARYFKVGQLADVDGYTLEAAPVGVDENVNRYVYTPAEESVIEDVTIEATAFKAAQLGESNLSAFASASLVECSELSSAEIDGHKVQYFTYRRNLEEAAEKLAEAAESTETDQTAETPAEDEVEIPAVQALNAYITVGDRSVIMQVRIKTETEADYVDDSVLVDAMNQFLTALSFENK